VQQGQSGIPEPSIIGDELIEDLRHLAQAEGMSHGDIRLRLREFVEHTLGSDQHATGGEIS